MIMFVCHLDTVPFGEINEWEDKNPLSGKIKNGFILGRGSLDDKGPISCALWASKCLSDLGVKLPFEVRTFVGADEETRFESQNYYLKKHKSPNLTFVLDGEFPFSYIEKSIYNYCLIIKESNSIIKNITATNTINMVPSKCTVQIELPYDRLKNIFKVYLAENNVTGEMKQINDDVTEITLYGRGTHAIFAKSGINAITYMLTFLNGMSKNLKIASFVKTFFHDDCYGNNLEINNIDSALNAGTNLNFGVIKKVNNEFHLELNIRFLKHKITHIEIEDQILSKTQKWFGAENVEIKNIKSQDGYKLDIENDLWTNIYSWYQDISGDTKCKPIVSAGGTYAKYFPNAACIGPILVTDQYNAHCVNEKMPIESLLGATKIYALLLYRLSQQHNLIK